MKFCPNYRLIRKLVKRVVIRRILFVLLLILFAEFCNGLLHAYSIYDRQRIHVYQEESAQQIEARAVIAAVAIRARREKRDLTPKEERLVDNLWAVSGYDAAENRADQMLRNKQEKH